MIVVGERINTSRKSIQKAVEERDADFIRAEALKQAEAGADFLDVNAGSNVRTESADLKWLMEVVQDAVEVPLCIDSPNPQVLEEAIALHRNGTPMINSITAEQERMEALIPLLKETDALVVALCMGGSGMPSNAQERLDAARTILERLSSTGIARERIYFDPVICPISTSPEAAGAALETVRTISTEFEGCHTICGLSNISFGLPKRTHINRSFLALMLNAGLDSVIMDPTEPMMMATLYATNAILGRDEFCLEYISAAREGKL